MYRKTNIIIALLLTAHIANAANILPVPESFLSKVWRCKWRISCYKTLGATITTINGTDRLTDSRSTINTNFANLNSDKIEVSTTSVGNITQLPNQVRTGTLTTGTWNATAIGVAYGGTGTTSPAQYQVVLGNGALGLTIASSTGTSGQTLQSNGANAYPSWQANQTDQSANYTWTGKHTFSSGLVSASTTIMQAFNSTSSRFSLNGIGYNAATSTPTASSTLSIDSRNSMAWDTGPVILFDKTITTASSTFGTYDFDAKNGLRVILQTNGLASAGVYNIMFNRDGGGNYYSRDFLTNRAGVSFQNESFAGTSIGLVSQATTSPVTLDFFIPNVAGTQKTFSWQGGIGNASALPQITSGAGTWQNTTNQITQITITSGVNLNANSRLTIIGY